MEIAIKILAIIGTIISILYLYKIPLAILGFFATKKFKSAKNQHTYGICVCARNEEKVIKNFLDSVAENDYPLDKITVFILAHNCTDATAKVAKEYNTEKLNVVVYEYDNPQEKTKGFALKYLFDKIEEDFGRESFDGYYIFDADNVISQNYLSKMNDSFDAGNKIITSFRNSKNANQNWISFSYAMHWMRTCLTENRGKSLVKLACRLQGTGYLFSNELVKDGWKYTSLTEDRSFCSDAVVQGYNITHCDQAIFYDEQPYKLKVALRQRLRWAKGHLISMMENSPKLLKNMVNPKRNFFRTYDCFFLNFPKNVESTTRKIISFILKIIIAILAFSVYGLLKGALITYLTGLLGMWLGDIFLAICVHILYRKQIVKENIFKRMYHILMFPFFDIIGKWCTYVALFKKVEWKPIPHDTVMDIGKLKNK